MQQSNNKLPDEVLYNPCGGCGATNPLQRCIGCFHPFEKKLTEEYTSLCEQYRELKVHCEKISKEHADLNLALAAMLNGYQNLSMYQKGWFTVSKDLIDAYTKMVIEYDRPGITQEKEVKP